MVSNTDREGTPESGGRDRVELAQKQRREMSEKKEGERSVGVEREGG